MPWTSCPRDLLLQARRSKTVVQNVRVNIGPVWPCNHALDNCDRTKCHRVGPHRLEHGPLQIPFEIDFTLDVVVKCHQHPKPLKRLYGTNADTRSEFHLHRLPISPRVQCVQRHLLPSTFPVSSQLLAVHQCPLNHHAVCPPWQFASQSIYRFDGLHGLELGIFCMKVARCMIVVVHGNDHTEELTDLRHASTPETTLSLSLRLPLAESNSPRCPVAGTRIGVRH
jgi:hypothetical protein